MKNRTILAVAATFLWPLAVSGQDANTSRAGNWSAWYGCWRAVAETPVGAASDVAPPVVCVLPGAEETTVRIATIENGSIAGETLVQADGEARPITDGGCNGTERAFFSADGQRVFTRAELACTGLGRTSTGVLAMVSESEWIDAQALTVNGQHAVRTIRYRAVSDAELPEWLEQQLPRDQQLAREAARLAATAPLGISEVIEASQTIAAPALEALLAARQHGFGLSAERLEQLADAGVARSTIDVMVGLSFPAVFAVGRPAPTRVADVDARTVAEQNAARAWVDDCYDPYFRSSRYNCGRYGYGYERYGFSPYGYSPYGYDRYGWQYGSAPTVIVVRQPTVDDAEPRGTAVKGRGYTRGGAPDVGSTRRATPRDSDSRATSTSSGGSSGAASTSSGSSSGTTRTAKPRGNN